MANNSLAEAVAVADDVVFAGPRQVLETEMTEYQQVQYF